MKRKNSGITPTTRIKLCIQVLDTTSWTTSRPLLPEILETLKTENVPALPHGWSVAERKTSQSNSFFSKRRITLDHKVSGLHVYGTLGRIEGWSASLPRVLHGSNGIQLKNDTEIAASRARVDELLSEISQPTEMAESLRRLDVAINLAFPDPEAVLRTFRLDCHPWIRRETTEYATGNIRFPGSEVVFQAYWKKPPVKSEPRQKKWHSPGVLRLEVQLKNISKIAEFLGIDPLVPLRQLPRRRDIYEAFRRFMLGFQRHEYRSDKCTMAGLLALCISRDVRLPSGETVMDWHRAGVSADAHRKMCNAVAANVARTEEVTWDKLLPDHTIPATIDVFPDGTTRTVPAVRLMRTWPTPRGDEVWAWMSLHSDADDVGE